jgi:hypothetical protein
MLRDDSMSDELLLALLDGPFKQVRDDNHVDPHSILVYDGSREPLIEAVDILDVLARYPCQGVNAQWNTNDVVGILQEKHNQYRKSMASHEISDEETNMTPACGTVVLIINPNQHEPHRWVGISALIEAGQQSYEPTTQGSSYYALKRLHYGPTDSLHHEMPTPVQRSPRPKRGGCPP